MSRLLILLLLPSTLFAQPKNEPLVDQVKSSIDRGVQFLRTKQIASGSWEAEEAGYDGGRTSLALLALLNSGVPVNDPAVAKGLVYLRNVNSDRTYVRALQTMALAEAKADDKKQILANVEWLLAARVYDENKKFLGWTYGKVPGGGFRSTDNSNTQYAVLGLWSAKQAGIALSEDVWREIRDYYLRSQFDDGAHRYQPFSKDDPQMTMTVAGLCGLLIAGLELNERREILQPDGTTRNCGVYLENPAVQKALAWVTKHYNVESSPQTFYHLYGLERVGRLSGLRFFGPYDWYREGCAYLVRQQKANGSWKHPAAWDQWPIVSTSFALLFLSKGRTPVLVSKAVHGTWPRREIETDWNNDRNDLRNLVPFAGKQLFGNAPLAWQNFDIMRAATPRGDNSNPTEDDLADTTAEMLQSPIFYITGHEAPRFTGVEKRLLQRYVENGGFIVAEACCGSPRFDKGFKALVEELWPDQELKALDAYHPVWTSFYAIKPHPGINLQGLSGNCKTILIYSPQDLSCRWESNKLSDGAGMQAFQIGTNLIAYATGLELPKPRLTKEKLDGKRQELSKTPAGYFKAAQIKLPGEPLAKAMPRLMDFVSTTKGLSVVLKADSLKVSDPGLVDYKFIYMHGKGGFQFDDEALEKLKFNLQTGGLLFADAACGQEAFDKAFRSWVQTQLFPGSKLEAVPANDRLFSDGLNGAEWKKKLRLRKVAGPMQDAEPFLEGIRHEDRWVVLYSKYDVGCALEGNKSSDCRGYDRESALRVARSAVLYVLDLPGKETSAPK